MSEKKLKVGDRVEWDTPQGATVGHVKKKLTRPMKIKTHKVAASEKNPEYLVETENRKSQPRISRQNSANAVMSAHLFNDAWDKTFLKSEKVEHRKGTFKNRYGITLSGDLYQPKKSQRQTGSDRGVGPFGAV